MSALAKPEKQYEWKLTIGNSPTLRATYSSCQKTAVGHMDKLILLATRSYSEKYNELCVTRKAIDETKMVGGMQEWTGEIGGAVWRIRIEKIGAA